MSERRTRTWLLVVIALVLAPFSVLLAATLLNQWPGGAPDLPNNVLLFVGAFVLVLAVMLGVGRLRPRDLGLRLADVAIGTAGAVAAWALAQILLVAGAAVVDGVAWSGLGTEALADTATNWLGAAFFEEVVFRGFLFAQLYLLLGERAQGAASRFWIAAVGSAAAFSLLHLPGLLFGDASAADAAGLLGATLAAGTLAAWLYLRTRNLFFVIGLHAFHNAPLSVVGGADMVAGLLVVAVGVALALAWPATAAPAPQPTSPASG